MTQQLGQTVDREVKMNHFIVRGSGSTETSLTGVLSPNNSQLSGPSE